eukprot:6084017-Prymnesium_polylepis.1
MATLGRRGGVIPARERWIAWIRITLYGPTPVATSRDTAIPATGRCVRLHRAHRAVTPNVTEAGTAPLTRQMRTQLTRTSHKRARSTRRRDRARSDGDCKSPRVDSPMVHSHHGRHPPPSEDRARALLTS